MLQRQALQPQGLTLTLLHGVNPSSPGSDTG